VRLIDFVIYGRKASFIDFMFVMLPKIPSSGFTALEVIVYSYCGHLISFGTG
jgi:hypothetical protein